LEFAANLKLDMSEENKKHRIQILVKKFKLEKCLDTLVGGILLKGISGGEKKRTSIAFELISDPAVLALDEPTSGLDSLTSYIIIRYMKQLASRHGKTIFMTIHQPNNDIYGLFDQLMLLVEGRFIYQGPAATAPDYFTRHFGLTCGEFENPPDYFMNIMHYENIANRERYPRYFETY
jgi:ABC-type multidrug transport system ATPase subunit